MINEMTMEMTLEMILELILEMIPELTSDQAEIGDPDGCPLTILTAYLASPQNCMTCAGKAVASLLECMPNILTVNSATTPNFMKMGS